MKYLALLILLAVSFSGCTKKVVCSNPECIQVYDTEDTSRLVLFFSAELERENRLFLEDSRIIYDKDHIKKICLRYSSQALLTLCEARALIVDVVEEFLHRLNNHSALSFQTETFPFTADSLDIVINFESFHGFYVDPLYIGMICLREGCTRFYAFDIKNQNIDWSHQRFEPYFKSRELALIKREADIPYYDKDNPPKKPSEYIYDRFP